MSFERQIAEVEAIANGKAKGFGGQAKGSAQPKAVEPPIESEKATEGLVKTRREQEKVGRRQSEQRQAEIIQAAALDEVYEQTLYTKARIEMSQMIHSTEFEAVVLEDVDDNPESVTTPDRQVTEGLQAFLGKTLLSGRLQKALTGS